VRVFVYLQEVSGPLTWVFLAWVLPMAIGGGFLAYMYKTRRNFFFVPWTAAVVAVVLFFAAWLTVHVGTNIAVQKAVTFNENWGGYEVQAYTVRTDCTRDGPCVHEYDCDPYDVKVVDRAAYTDDKGNYHPEISHWETRYHACPYTDYEVTFKVLTTLGDYTIESHWLPENPDSHRWRSGRSVPDSIPSGTPKFWQQAHDRIAAGDPGPVVKRMQYDNYILASQQTILKQYSDSIEQYKKDKLLPELSRDPVFDPYYANKMFFVGVNVPGNWQYELNQFDAALGMDLQGDMYVVVVDADKIRDPDDYMMALIAYWTSDQQFGKDALAKNAIVVVVGTVDGKAVDWARAKTGMPVGNEGMLLDIREDLPGTALTPSGLLGEPRAARLYKKPGKDYYSVDIAHGDGALERIIWGQNKFERICMKCDDENETGKVGYQYLKNEIQPGPGARVLMMLITLIVGLCLWCGALYLSDPSFMTASYSRRSRF
jgi:hypothetical protein